MITSPPHIWGKEVLIGSQRMYHVRRRATKEEIKRYVFWYGDLYNYLRGQRNEHVIEIKKFFDLYPLPYSPPDCKYIHSSLRECEDSDLFSEGLISEFECNIYGITDYPQRLQIILNIAIEFYKFTGKIIWRNPFGEEEYRKYFEPWKDEHKKRFEVLMKIIEDYWAEEEREEKEKNKEK